MFAAALLLALAPADGGVTRVRDGLVWTKAAIESGGTVRVTFLGGSITENDGFRPLVEAGLRARFPGVTWEFHNAGVASTGSTTGAFRFLPDAVLAGGAWRNGNGATLVIVEAAVNDDQDERLSAADAGWGMESIARFAEVLGPAEVAPADLLFVHFPNEAIVAGLRAGDAPVPVAAHEQVAEHYRVPSVNVVAEVAKRIDAGALTWEEYGGTHPGPAGHRLAAELIVGAVARCVDAPAVPGYLERYGPFRPPLRADAADGTTLARPGWADESDRASFEKLVGDGWATGTPDWPALPGRCRERFLEAKLLHTIEPGATLTVPPDFTALGLYVLAGPDAGAVEVSVPGEEPRTVELYHDPHSAGLHYPRTVLLYRSSRPPAGPIVVTTKAGERGGTAVRVVGVGVGARAE